jgi:hypothetical protein
MSPARVTIARTSDEDARERQVVVSIDGEKVATLLFGGTITRELPPGPHRLRAHNTLVWKTVDFDLEPGEDAAFTVVNRPGRGTFGLLSLLGARPLYVDVRRELAAG